MMAMAKVKPGTCTGPGKNGKPCGHLVRAAGLCSSHLSQRYRAKKEGEPDRPLAPLGTRAESERAVLSIRVSPETKEKAMRDREGARSAIETWAKRKP